MPKLSTYTVQVKADTGNLRKNMKRAENQMRQSSDKMGSAVGRVGKGLQGLTKSLLSLKGLLLGGAAVGMAYFAKRSIDAADSIAKTADKLGLTTDALQELRFAADLAGVAQTALDMGMQRFTRRVAEAVQGKGELIGVLEQYNILTTDSAGRTRDMNDVLGDLADVMLNTTDDAERLRIAFKAFDSEGVAMVNMLKEGRAALEATRAKAREYGLVIDEALVRKAVEAKDAITILTEQLKAQATIMVAKLSPAIQAVSEDLSMVINFWTELAGKIAEGLFPEEVLKTPREELAELEQQLAMFNDRIENLSSNWLERLANKKSIERFKTRAEEVKKQIEALRKGITAHGLGELAVLQDVPQEALDKQKKLAEWTEMTKEEMRSLQDTYNEWGIDTMNILPKINAQLEEEAAKIKATKDALDEKIGALATMHDITQETVIFTEKMTAALKESTAATSKMMVNNLNTIEVEVRTFTSTFQDEILEATRTGEATWTNMIDAMIADLQRLILQTQITDPLTKFFTNLLAPSAPGWSASDVMGGLKPMQHGGKTKAWQPYVVGEKGPEIFMSDSGGEIVTHRDSRKLAGRGGVTVEQTLNIFPGLRAEIRAEIDAARGKFMRDAVAAVLAAKGRGGDIGRSL